MELGAFSVSLSVKNIEDSKVFYQKLGFKVVGGDQSQNWLIVRNGDHTIGLFQGMFEGNIMTFNPGWDKSCQTLTSYTDVRVLLKAFEAQGVEILQKAIDGESGPSSFSVQDPDGNAILVDQHV
ncbi:VOC family protein [Shewanella sp. D64]|uniref:VOC family protein n=1 Tax=unclassified Shewanella TaxID=196818 RepID=UPI0022BA5DEE|nr:MULTISPECIES: VOC family protein [unclassified Shewanella]MEC4727225.1 VOC family protein [Shewanella sp. D64]MEC4739158.1 VOC family protein [Shewanella sp. E94]WBJ95503.1 VOC family protein [Shewanella sp. MTB7]